MPFPLTDAHATAPVPSTRLLTEGFGGIPTDGTQFTASAENMRFAGAPSSAWNAAT
jgi:hypothetical protein